MTETISGLPPATDAPSERNKFTAPIMRALGDVSERDRLFIAATGKSIAEHRRENGDVLPLEVVKAAAEALPEFLADRDAEAEAEAAALAEAERNPGSGRLERIKRAILAGVGHTDLGEAATPEALAMAQAEADAEVVHEKLAEQGRREREKAAAALVKRQQAAIAKAQANLPVPPAALVDLEAKAKAAIDELRAEINAYGRQIATAKAELAAGGVVEMPVFGSPDEIDWDNHGHEHRVAVTIDGVLYSTETVAHCMARVADYAGGTRFGGVSASVYEAARGDL